MYRFKKEHQDATIQVKHFKEPVTAANLTDSKAELIVEKYPHLAHNFERVQPNSSETEEKGGKKTAKEVVEEVKSFETIEELEELEETESRKTVLKAIAERKEELEAV